MTDLEFDLLDELYFVQPYEYLKDTLGWQDEVLLDTLASLFQKGFIKCLFAPDDEVFRTVDFRSEGTTLFYLATKKGLMEHNAL